MFSNCSTLTSLYLPNFSTNNIKNNLETVFERCEKLVLSIKKGQCSNLIELIPDYIKIIEL